MKIADAMRGINQLFIDTAPIIYFVEANPNFISLVDVVFKELDAGSFIAVISPVTVAECLMVPIRNRDQRLQQIYFDLFTKHTHTICNTIDLAIGQKAAELKARYNLRTPDSLQLATAIMAGCDAVLTNDKDLKRVVEIKIIVVAELEL